MYKRQLNILIQLAVIDQNFAGKEMKWIYSIAKANGMSEEEVKELLRQPEPIKDLDKLTEEEKFEYLYMVIQLMKVDGQVFKSEIAFCEEIAVKLGYKKQVVGELSKYIYSDPTITADREHMMMKAKKFLLD